MWQAPRFHHWVLATFLALPACRSGGRASPSPGGAASGQTALALAMQRAREEARGRPAGSSSPPPSAPVLTGLAADCAALCSRTADLHCGNVAACVAFCVDYAALPTCEAILRAYVDCARDEPLDHWECDPAMTPALKSSYCATERDGFSRCVRGSHDRPLHPG